jgi:phage gp29-like protein
MLKLPQLFDKLIPTKKATAVNDRFEPTFIANLMDVDRVHQILRNAEAGDTEDLFALYRDMVLADAHLQTEFGKRKLGVLGDALAVLPNSKNNALDGAAAEAVKRMIDDCPAFIRGCMHLLDSTLYPVAVVEKIYRATPDGRYELADLIPVPHRLLDFKDGTLKIHETDAQGMKLSGSFTPPTARYIVHRGHLLSTPDNWGGPMRSLVFWWLLSAMDRDWWARFLERFGAPFILAKYDTNDNAARSKLTMALSAATRLFGLVVSKGTEAELIQATANQSGEAFERFHAVCNREKSKLILGQTLSADAQSTGMGSGVAKGQSAVREDIRQFDALMLGTTLRQQLARQFLEINRIPGDPPRIVWSPDASEISESTGTLIANLAQAGVELTDDALQVLGERIGLEVRRRAPAAISAFAASPHAPNAAVLADKAGDHIAGDGAATLARAFRGSLAPIRKIILDSTSSEDCEQRIREFYADWSPERLAPLVEEALVAYAANGAVVNVR